MNKEKSLIKNTVIVTVGKICTQLISFFLLPLYTSLLTTEEYGVVDLLNTLINLIVPILLLQIDQGIFRYLIDCRDNKENQNQLITVTMFFTFSQIVICLVIFSVIMSRIHNEYKYFLLTNLIISLLSALMLQVARGLGDNSKYAVGSFLSGSVTVVLNVFLIAYLRLGAYGMLIASLIGNAVCTLYIFIDMQIYKRIKKKYYDQNVLKKLLGYSIPLIPNVISWWIVTASDRIIITLFLNLSANGIYSAANKFSGVLTMLYSVFNLTWTESAAINIESKDRDEFFSKIYNVVIRIFGCICLNTISIMPFVFPIMINDKFNDAYVQIPILIIASMFNILISFLGSIYVAKKLTKEIAKTSIFAAIINLSINCSLVHFIGLYAASLSTAIAYFVMYIYRYVDSKKYVKLSISRKFVVSMIILYIITLIAYYIRITSFHIIVIIITILYTLYVNKDNAYYIINLVKAKFNH